MQIVYLASFARMAKKLGPEVKKQARERTEIFQNDVFDPRLKTHKLHGKMAGLWAFWINNRDRIVFEFGGKDEIIFHFVGDHSVYE
ncbi:MAG: type II toxin-antitoxin system mRNA interferase toxin, RelE/StbE family [Patescibacteria group bacterium]